MRHEGSCGRSAARGARRGRAAAVSAGVPARLTHLRAPPTPPRRAASRIGPAAAARLRAPVLLLRWGLRRRRRVTHSISSVERLRARRHAAGGVELAATRSRLRGVAVRGRRGLGLGLGCRGLAPPLLLQARRAPLLGGAHSGGALGLGAIGLGAGLGALQLGGAFVLQLGLDALGLDALGLDALGLDALGLDALGLGALQLGGAFALEFGFDAFGLDTLRLDALRLSNALRPMRSASMRFASRAALSRCARIFARIESRKVRASRSSFSRVSESWCEASSSPALELGFDDSTRRAASALTFVSFWTPGGVTGAGVGTEPAHSRSTSSNGKVHPPIGAMA